jgi:hypothetical protein
VTKGEKKQMIESPLTLRKKLLKRRGKGRPRSQGRAARRRLAPANLIMTITSKWIGLNQS